MDVNIHTKGRDVSSQRGCAVWTLLTYSTPISSRSENMHAACDDEVSQQTTADRAQGIRCMWSCNANDRILA